MSTSVFVIGVVMMILAVIIRFSPGGRVGYEASEISRRWAVALLILACSIKYLFG